MTEPTTPTVPGSTPPPERCPVCEAVAAEELGIYDNDSDKIVLVHFVCGATWDIDRDWPRPCPHAMTAALRCRATLTPTAAEQAREALVAASLKRRAALDVFLLDHRQVSDVDYYAYDVAVDEWNAAVAAYLAAGPQVAA